MFFFCQADLFCSSLGFFRFCFFFLFSSFIFSRRNFGFLSFFYLFFCLFIFLLIFLQVLFRSGFSFVSFLFGFGFILNLIVSDRFGHRVSFFLFLRFFAFFLLQNFSGVLAIIVVFIIRRLAYSICITDFGLFFFFFDFQTQGTIIGTAILEISGFGTHFNVHGRLVIFLIQQFNSVFNMLHVGISIDLLFFHRSRCSILYLLHGRRSQLFFRCLFSFGFARLAGGLHLLIQIALNIRHFNHNGPDSRIA